MSIINVDIEIPAAGGMVETSLFDETGYLCIVRVDFDGVWIPSGGHIDIAPTRFWGSIPGVLTLTPTISSANAGAGPCCWAKNISGNEKLRVSAPSSPNGMMLSCKIYGTNSDCEPPIGSSSSSSGIWNACSSSPD